MAVERLTVLCEVSNGIKNISDKLSAALVVAESENGHSESKKVTLCA